MLFRVDKGDFVGHPFRGNQWTGGRFSVLGPENVQMQMAKPLEILKRHHGIQQDWTGTVAPDPAKRLLIAKTYKMMKPIEDTPQAKAAWDAAEIEIRKQFKQLTEQDGIKVEFVDTDPYKDFHDMHKQVTATGVLKVLKTEATGGHPYWPNEVNDMFRAVHDAYGHLGTGRGFDRHGEEAAYQAHRSMFPPEAQPALATELRAQNQFLIQYGFFGDQKIGLLPEELRKRMGLSKSVFRTSDDENLYGLGGSHHVSAGRHFVSLSLQNQRKG